MCIRDRDGVVQNLIEISNANRAEYEELEQCKLVDVEDYVCVSVGDTYDEETGLFYRDGVRVDAIFVLSIRKNMRCV